MTMPAVCIIVSKNFAFFSLHSFASMVLGWANSPRQEMLSAMKAVLAQLMIEDESLAELISIAISLGPQRAQICSGLAVICQLMPTYLVTGI